MLANIFFALFLIGLSAVLFLRHWQQWRNRDRLDPRDADFFRRQLRRRVQTSAMIGNGWSGRAIRSDVVRIQLAPWRTGWWSYWSCCGSCCWPWPTSLPRGCICLACGVTCWWNKPVWEAELRRSARYRRGCGSITAGHAARDLTPCRWVATILRCRRSRLPHLAIPNPPWAIAQLFPAAGPLDGRQISFVHRIAEPTR